jgi:hypothetical protein
MFCKREIEKPYPVCDKPYLQILPKKKTFHSIREKKISGTQKD